MSPETELRKKFKKELNCFFQLFAGLLLPMWAIQPRFLPSNLAGNLQLPQPVSTKGFCGPAGPWHQERKRRGVPVCTPGFIVLPLMTIFYLQKSHRIDNSYLRQNHWLQKAVGTRMATEAYCQGLLKLVIVIKASFKEHDSGFLSVLQSNIQK